MLGREGQRAVHALMTWTSSLQLSLCYPDRLCRFYGIKSKMSRSLDLACPRPDSDCISFSRIGKGWLERLDRSEIRGWVNESTLNDYLGTFVYLYMHSFTLIKHRNSILQLVSPIPSLCNPFYDVHEGEQHRYFDQRPNGRCQRLVAISSECTHGYRYC